MENKTLSRKKLFVWISFILLFLLIVVSLDAFWEIRKISTGTLWHIPSKIYSDVTWIRQGVDTERIGLEQRLRRLRYRLVEDVKFPGEYGKSNNEMTIYLHPFDYPDSKFDGLMIKVKLKNATVEDIIRADTAKRIKEIRLEPEVIAQIFGEGYEDRLMIDLDECPRNLIDAVICTEDKRFFHHFGIDIPSIIRAIFVNIEHGKIVEGGSTITQQLIKNMFLTSKRSIFRKMKEAWMAFIMEMIYTKEDILQMYINEIYMGQSGHVSIHGMARAARLYFDKDISKITLDEAATLAGIIRAPNSYSPYTHPNRAIARRDTVLELMWREDKITKEVYEEAIKEPLDVVPINTRKRQAPYFVDYLLACIEDQYSRQCLTRGGYHIFTTIDMHMQFMAETMISHSMESIVRRKGLDIEGATVICDPKTGEIKAMVGGGNYAKTQFNRATQMKRQIGSLIKPIIYYTALRRGYTISTFIQDAPVTVTLEDGDTWTPANFDGLSHGSIMLIDALAHSYNMATVRMGMKIGVDNIRAEIKKVLPACKINKNPSILLGAIELSPLDVAMFYSAFANMGFALKPSAIKAITTEDETIIHKEDHKPGQEILDSDVIFLVNTALNRVVTSGTAKRSDMYDMPSGVCGKTGTTDGLRDSWFVGFTPDIVVVVWLGNDGFKPIGLTGATGAMPVAAMILGAIESPRQWARPADIVLCRIDPSNGKLASLGSRNAEILPYIKGTQPTEVSQKDVPRVLRFFKSLFK
ncbi:MAG: PBP1A family penicillin-binding protein [Thermodesulfobacteriota bacterium]|nr:PBP1A family penicillin-binding protein [Thermodesulfobacteriota bacterium]